MTEIKVEIVSADTGKAAFRGVKEMPDFSQRVKDVGNSLNQIARDLREYPRELDQRREGWDLDEVTLSFSLDLQAEAGLVVVGRVSGKAGFQATMSWKRPSPVATP